MALREDRTKADLLRRTLASSSKAVEPCPDPEILAAYADRALDPEETARYELHFSQCAHCREQLAAMVLAVGAAGATDRALARSHQAPAWYRDWRVLAPVAAALVFSAAMVALSPKPQQPSGPLVAMDRTPETPVAIAPMAPAPATPQPEGRESSPPKAAAAPSGALTRPNAESLQRIAPPDNSVKVRSGNEQADVSQAPVEQELRANSISHLPLNARNYTALDKKSEPLALAPATPPPSPAPSAQKQNADAEHIHNTTQSVTVESEAQTVTTAPAPNRLVAGNGVGNGIGVSAGAARSAANSNLHSVNQTVTVESARDRDLRTIVPSPDPQILWRISSGRYVERSTDAGATWLAQWTSVNAHVVAGSAPSADTCWLVGSGGIVLLTKDGKKWLTLEPPTNADFVAVSASSAASATITSTDGHRFETRDGGKHWIPAP